MAEYLGNDLSKVANEADKLMLSMKGGEELSAVTVEEKIGISKDFNIFELYSAFATRNIYKANLILRYFASNSKSHPIQLTLPSIFAFFHKVMSVHAAGKNADKNKVAAEIGVSPYFIQEYLQAAQTYPPAVCMRNIGYLHEYDLKSKGVNGERMTDQALLQELVYKLMH